MFLFLSARPALEVWADPGDDVILAVAVAGQVEFVVSGDTRHVLPVGTFEGIPIVTTQGALKRLKNWIRSGRENCLIGCSRMEPFCCRVNGPQI